MNHRFIQRVQVDFSFPVVFTRGLFAPDNETLRDVLAPDGDVSAAPQRCLVLLDRGVRAAFPALPAEIRAWFAARRDRFLLAGPVRVIRGGEAVKQSSTPLLGMIEALRAAAICRHSWCIAVGGGAFLDAAGLAAALFHRGVRLVRVPTTALAQCDSGVGVKNAINFAGSKNLLGTFAPPAAVLNDTAFLDSLPLPLLLDGVAEAIKVAAIRDASFLRQIARHAPQIARGDLPILRRILRHCAELHLAHIATSGDPFELGSARPLDYGHWLAHKLESLSRHRISHGHAVAIGIATDALYAALSGLLSAHDARLIIHTVQHCGLPLSAPELARSRPDGSLEIFDGLEEFRAHLGGRLTLTVPSPSIGHRLEIHEVDRARMTVCLRALAGERTAATRPAIAVLDTTKGKK